jgi:hypothetical protein
MYKGSKSAKFLWVHFGSIVGDIRAKHRWIVTYLEETKGFWDWHGSATEKFIYLKLLVDQLLGVGARVVHISEDLLSRHPKSDIAMFI